jgi:lipoprotein-anchoring transpeptidase ErfK/SrfK
LKPWIVVLVVAAGGALAAAALRHEHSDRPAARASTLDAAPVPDPAFTVGSPVALHDGRHESRWAPLRRRVAARARPAAGAAVVAVLDRRTPEGTTSIVATLSRVTAPDGRIWVKARLPILPNGSTGWLPRSALGGYGTVTTRLVIDRRRLVATLQRDGRPVWRAPIGIGTGATPTPAGVFFVRNRLTRYRSPFYGPVAFGTSARSATLTDWPGGGFIGIHGTDRPDLIPGRVSHGCIRLRNAAILRLARLMPVGTPIRIR